MSEKWVFNASPLILLGKAGQLAWLDKLGTVIIPSAVADEIRAGSPDDPARIFVEDPTRDDDLQGNSPQRTQRPQSQEGEKVSDQIGGRQIRANQWLALSPSVLSVSSVVRNRS